MRRQTRNPASQPKKKTDLCPPGGPAPGLLDFPFIPLNLPMYSLMLMLHITAVCLVVGTLFVQSLAVVFRLRLQNAEQISGAQWVQARIYKFIYYPILVGAVGSGFYLAVVAQSFSQGKWLHWKLVLLVVLIGFGFLNGRQIQNKNLPKFLALFVHIGIFCTAAAMIYLAAFKPF